jgi:hypothetical protein
LLGDWPAPDATYTISESHTLLSFKLDYRSYYPSRIKDIKKFYYLLEIREAPENVQTEIILEEIKRGQTFVLYRIKQRTLARPGIVQIFERGLIYCQKISLMSSKVNDFTVRGFPVRPARGHQRGHLQALSGITALAGIRGDERDVSYPPSAHASPAQSGRDLFDRRRRSSVSRGGSSSV